MGKRRADVTKDAKIKEQVIQLYVENPTLEINSVAYRCGTNIEKAEEFIEEYKKGLVAYFNFGIAPSMCDANTFFLFSDNGTEKKLLKEGDNIYSKQNITQLEALFIKINLGYEVKKVNQK